MVTCLLSPFPLLYALVAPPGGGLVLCQFSRIMISGRMPPATCSPLSSSSVSPASPVIRMDCLYFTLFLPSSDNIHGGIISGSPSPSILPKLVIMVNHLPSFPPQIPLVSSFLAATCRKVYYSLMSRCGHIEAMWNQFPVWVHRSHALSRCLNGYILVV
jgi:hypothetical protein